MERSGTRARSLLDTTTEAEGELGRSYGEGAGGWEPSRTKDRTLESPRGSSGARDKLGRTSGAGRPRGGLGSLHGRAELGAEAKRKLGSCRPRQAKGSIGRGRPYGAEGGLDRLHGWRAETDLETVGQGRSWHRGVRRHLGGSLDMGAGDAVDLNWAFLRVAVRRRESRLGSERWLSEL